MYLNTLPNIGSWPFLSVVGLAELYPKGPNSIETASFCLSTNDVTCRRPSIMYYVCPTPADPVRRCIHHSQKGFLPKTGTGLSTQPAGLDLSLNLDYHPGGTLQVSYGYVSSAGSISSWGHFGYGLYGVTGCVLPFLVEYSTSRADEKFQDELMAIANCKTRHHLFAP